MHKSVLYKEAIEGLNINPSGRYIDATLGYGGHSGGILGLLNEKGFLFAFDQDEDAINYSKTYLGKISDNFEIIKSNFKDMKSHVEGKVNGILFDLGVSSPQLDTPSRGFSYHNDAPLDMRMDKDNSLSAYEVVNNYAYEKLVDIFFIYGEEKYAKSIAKNIVSNRPIKSTMELAEVIKSSVPESYRNKSHPARKIFQAIRIEVNNELKILESSILDAFELLESNGRMCIITFHSLEDRIVKNVFNTLCKDNPFANKLPITPQDMKAKAKLITRKAIIPSEEEIKENKRSRSAKLRIIEKI